MDVPLFDGEILVRPNGLYTFVHWYQHPETGRKVVLTGMYHDGDPEYFKHVRRILDRMDVVLYEGPPATLRRTGRRSRKLKTITLKTSGQRQIPDINLHFFALFGLYQKKAVTYCGLRPQGWFFDYARAGWACGDALWYREPRITFEHRVRTCLRSLSNKRKAAITERIARDLSRMETGTYTRDDFRKANIFIWSDQKTTRTFQRLLGTFRDRMCLREFDRIMKQKEPSRTGIMFGAAHIATQRKFLEKRGYVRIRSKALRVMTFK